MFMQLSASLLLLVVSVKSDVETCTTPGGQMGECIQLNRCPGLMDIFANYIRGTEESLNKFICAKDGLVCCPPRWTSVLYNEELSDRRYCGYQHTDDYVPKTTSISIHEFPWLARIMLVKKSSADENGLKMCQGTLINNRYVLSVAHCMLREYTVTGVRLGEFNIKNNTDCVEDFRYGLECSTTEDFAVEEVITHSFYSIPTLQNDIALIRLNKTVGYSDYIRPICLPISGTTFAKPGDELYTSGWGSTGIAEAEAEVKKKIFTTLITNEECQEKFKRARRISITPQKMCTIDNLDKTGDFTCTGDSGAPVMFSYKHQWHIEGMVSDGIGCRRGLPEIHTRVSSYINWISQHLRP